MKEELTEKMHGEFSVSEATEIKHRAWIVLSMADFEDKFMLEHWAGVYNVSMDDVERHSYEYFSLLE